MENGCLNWGVGSDPPGYLLSTFLGGSRYSTTGSFHSHQQSTEENTLFCVLSITLFKSK